MNRLDNLMWRIFFALVIVLSIFGVLVIINPSIAGATDNTTQAIDRLSDNLTTQFIAFNASLSDIDTAIQDLSTAVVALETTVDDANDTLSATAITFQMLWLLAIMGMLYLIRKFEKHPITDVIFGLYVAYYGFQLHIYDQSTTSLWMLILFIILGGYFIVKPFINLSKKD